MKLFSESQRKEGYESTSVQTNTARHNESKGIIFYNMKYYN